MGMIATTETETITYDVFCKKCGMFVSVKDASVHGKDIYHKKCYKAEFGE